MKGHSKKYRWTQFLASLTPGKVYRLEELKGLSKDRYRDLMGLLETGRLCHPGPGLYYRPKKLGKFNVPAENRQLLKGFLKGTPFLVRHLSDFNRLGLGMVQHTTTVYVYNKKRVGEFQLDGRKYSLRIRKFPSRQTDEYLFVDMLNSLGELGEDSREFLASLEKKLPKMNFHKEKLLETAEKYGKNWVKRYLKKQERLHVFSS